MQFLLINYIKSLPRRIFYFLLNVFFKRFMIAASTYSRPIIYRVKGHLLSSSVTVRAAITFPNSNSI